MLGERWDKMAYMTKNGTVIDKNDPNFTSEVIKGALPLIFMSVDV